MQTVVIVIHLLIVIALVGIVLIQRSEGGGLGIGGGSGFMSARGTKNALTRMTAILAGCFFLSSIILTVLETTSNRTSNDILERVPASSGTDNNPIQLQIPEGQNLSDQLNAPDTNATKGATPVQDNAEVPTNTSKESTNEDNKPAQQPQNEVPTQ